MEKEAAFSWETSAKALKRMEELGISATPENYTVWYNYCANAVLALNRSINILISNRQEFSTEVCADLYERFFGIDRQADTLRQISKQIETAVAEAVQMLSNAGNQARTYNASLGDTADMLGGSVELNHIREIVRRVIGETQNMIDRSDILEKELSKSTEEIGELRRQVETASREAMTDALTSIGNRKLFDSRLKTTMQESMEQGGELCLLICDIDYFKKFNDNYGHQFGDMVLQLVARTLAENVRGTDVPVRYGGEEFAILLPETTLDDALGVAEKLRSNIASRVITKRGSKEKLGSITMSLGASSYRLGEPPHVFIARADAALYKAKQTGRNRVLSERDLVQDETNDYSSASDTGLTHDEPIGGSLSA